MKKTCLLFVFAMLVGTSFAQVKTPKFALGISSDFLAVPLTNQSFQTQPVDVYVSYIPIRNLNFKVGYDHALLLDAQSKTYDSFSGLMIGAGYTVWRDKSGIFSNELGLSLTESFKDFAAFKNYHADLGVRFNVFDAFYLGTGIRLSHNESTFVTNTPTNSLNWFFQLGYQFHLTKKQTVGNKR
jgi:hypothetical protein